MHALWISSSVLTFICNPWKLFFISSRDSFIRLEDNFDSYWNMFMGINWSQTLCWREIRWHHIYSHNLVILFCYKVSLREAMVLLNFQCWGVVYLGILPGQEAVVFATDARSAFSLLSILNYLSFSLSFSERFILLLRKWNVTLLSFVKPDYLWKGDL